MNEFFFGLIVWASFTEDFALAGSFAFIANDKISLPMAALANFIGISWGNMVVYLLGYWAVRSPYLSRFQIVTRTKIFMQSRGANANLGLLILGGRMVPGARTPIYLGAGLAQYSPWKFFLLSTSSTALWVALVFTLGASLLDKFKENWLIILLVTLSVWHVARKIANSYPNRPKLSDFFRL